MTPTRAAHGPATRDQQAPERCQRFMLAVVDPGAGAATVTSWAAPAVLASSLARVAGHEVALGCGVALRSGTVARRFGLGAAVGEGGAGAGMGGGVVVVGFVASAAGLTEAEAGGPSARFKGEAHAPARRALPSAAAINRCSLNAMTQDGTKRGAPPLVLPLSFC